MRMGLGLGMRGAARRGVLDPAALFANGENGLFYDWSDASTLSQNIDGSGAITADGQASGKTLDKSGNGHHATASANDTARPTFRTAGGISYMRFDGSNDKLDAPSLVFPVNTTFTRITALRRHLNATGYILSPLASGAGLTTSASLSTSINVPKWTMGTQGGLRPPVSHNLNELHVVIERYRFNGYDWIGLDDLPHNRLTQSNSELNGLRIGGWGGGGFFVGADMFGLAIVAGTPPLGALLAVARWFAAKQGRSLGPPWKQNGTGTPRILVVEGDSITAGTLTGNVSYVDNYAPNASPATTISKIASSGAYLDSWRAREELADTPWTSGRKNIFSVMPGNDTYGSYPQDGGSRAAWLQSFKEYLVRRRYWGYGKIVVSTILPRTTPAGFNAERNIVNPFLRDLVPQGYADAIWDAAAHPTMGPDAAAADASRYSDGIHPTALGQTELEADPEFGFRTVINAL